MNRVIQFIGACWTAWMSVMCIRFAAEVADSPWWFTWSAASCVFGLLTMLLAANLVAATVRQ